MFTGVDPGIDGDALGELGPLDDEEELLDEDELLLDDELWDERDGVCCERLLLDEDDWDRLC